MSITDLGSTTSQSGEVTSVWRYDEADTYVVQSGRVHLSFFEDEFKDFARTVYEALMTLERGEEPIVRALHRVSAKGE